MSETTTKPGGEPANTTTCSCGDSNLSEKQFEYAWNWFEFHANQRVKVFNFFVLTLGLLITVSLTAITDYFSNPEGFKLILIRALAIFGFVFALGFHRLDHRNKALVWYGEDLLRHLERRWMFQQENASGEQLACIRTKNGGWVKDYPRHGFGALVRSAPDPNNENLGSAPAPDSRWDRFWGGEHRIWFPLFPFTVGVLALALLALSFFPVFTDPAAPADKTENTESAHVTNIVTTGQESEMACGVYVCRFPNRCGALEPCGKRP